MNFSNFFSAAATKEDNLTVMWICWMHFIWGIASSMIFSLLPIFIVNELGGNSKSFGLLEGSVVFLSFMTKCCTGFIMDIFKKKLPIFKVGAILTAIGKLLFACAPNMFIVFVAKSIDKFAKGLRQAPSDAILAELAIKKGFTYSFRHMMNISGFFTGSIIISIIMHFSGQNFRLIFSVSVVPTLIAIYILKTKVKYNGDVTFNVRELHKWKIKDIKLMSREYWHFIVIVSFLMFNRFSEGFITLRAKEVLPQDITYFPLFMSVYEVCAILIAIPAGRLSDKFDVRKVLLFGLSCLFIADIFGIIANNALAVIAVYLFAGMHLGATHGILGSIVAKMAPKHLIGTAFAFFYCIEGVLLFFSNNLAGQSSKIAQLAGLQESAGPFFVGIFAASFSILYLCILIRKKIHF